MIKKISNLTQNCKIEIESKCASYREKAWDNEKKYYMDDVFDGSRGVSAATLADDILFVKLKFIGLPESQKIGNVMFNLSYKGAYSQVGMYILKLKGLDMSDSALKEEAERLRTIDASSSTSDPNYPILVSTFNLNAQGNSFNDGGKNSVAINITDICNTISSNNNEIMFAIRNNVGLALRDFLIYTPEQKLEENSNLELCAATLIEANGISPTHKYDDHTLYDKGSLKVNLYNGQPIYLLDIFSTSSKEYPISFSAAYNKQKADHIVHLHNNWTPNFHYEISYEDDCYILEDYTGYKKVYRKLDQANEQDKEIIKTIYDGVLTRELYYHAGDSTYFYIDNSVIYLYDSQKNKMEIELGELSEGILTSKVQSIKDVNNNGLTFTWSNNRINKISNTDEEEVLFTYNSEGYLINVLFKNLNRIILINYEPDKVIFELRNFLYDTFRSGVNAVGEVIEKVELEYDNGYLSKVTDVNKGKYLYLSSPNNKVTTVYLADVETDEKLYQVTYEYTNGTMRKTKVTNHLGKYVYYYFDIYGRVITELDSQARTKSYNYDEYVEGNTDKLVAESKVKHHGYNLLASNITTSEDDSLDASTWEVEAGNGENFSNVDGGISGKKCLKIECGANETISLKKEVTLNECKKLYLKGYIKHPMLTNNSVNISLRAIYSVYEGENSSIPLLPITKVVNLDEQSSNWYPFEDLICELPDQAENVIIEVTITITNLNGAIYLDNLTLTRYGTYKLENNIINGYMEHTENNLPIGWTFQNINPSIDKVVYTETSDEHSKLLGNKVMKFGERKVDSGSSNNYTEPRIMGQIVSLKGKSGESLTYSVFSKANAMNEEIYRSVLTIKYLDGTREYFEFDFQKNFNNWQVLTRDIMPKKDYEEIEVTIEYNGCSEAYFDSFQLYKDTYGTYYNYDNYSHITEKVSGNGNTTQITYKDNKVSSKYFEDGSIEEYKYNGDNQLVEIINSNGLKTSYVYEESGKRRLISATQENEYQEEITKTIAYNDEENKETITNEFGESATISYDKYRNIKNILLPNGLLEQYIYNDKSQLNKLYTIIEELTDADFTRYNNIPSTVSKVGVTYENSINYDNMGNIVSLSTSNNNIYEFEYDKFGRLTKVKHNDQTLETKEYGLVENSINKGLLTKKQYGTSGDYYEFEYDEDNLLRVVSLNGVDIVKYGYDEEKRISYYNDKSINQKVYISYDEEGRVASINQNDTNYFEYEYDNLNNLQRVTYTIGDKTRTVNYDYPYEFNEYSKRAYFNRIANLYSDEVIGGANTNGIFGAKSRMGAVESVTDTDLNLEVFNFNTKNNYFIYDLKTFNSSRKIGYAAGKRFNYVEWNKKFYYNKTFYAWIKPTSNPNNIVNILGFKNNTTNIINISSIPGNLYISKSGELSYMGAREIVSTTSKLNYNEWNLVGINFIKYLDEDNTKAKLILNNEVTSEFEITEKVNKIKELVVGCQINCSYDVLPAPFKMCMIGGGSYSYSDQNFRAIYQEGLKYLESDERQKYSGLFYYDEDMYDGFEVTTLKGNFTTSKGAKRLSSPRHDISYKNQKDRFFEYDDERTSHVVGCYNGIVNLTTTNKDELRYKMNLETEGTITLNFKIKTDAPTDKRYIFACYENSQTTNGLALYFDTSRWLHVEYGSSDVITYCALGDHIWHHLFVTFDSDRIIVYVDGEIASIIDTSIDLTNHDIYIGHNPLSNTMSFDGNIEMLAFTNEVLTAIELRDRLVNKYCVQIRKFNDSMGRVTKNQIKTNSTTFDIDYIYNSTRPIKEEYSNGEEINYIYDNMGNIISRITNNEKSNSYEYDKLNRLVKEVREDGTTEEYKYDIDSNIKIIKTYISNSSTRNIKQFDYSNNAVKITTNGTTTTYLEYNDPNKGFPSKMKVGLELVSLGWNGNRLASIGTNISYDYNLSGFRTKKTTPNETTSFVLDGNKIINMKKVLNDDTTIDIDFMYDQNGMLVQAKTQEGSYFYVRDITGNINGLIDTSGNYVVKYTYNAWGKVLSTTVVQNTLIATHNPFIYKGYYYDSETQLYWVSSRYYSPELCRFISPDSVDYLDPESINGLNLYAYCNNNPIMYADPSGHFALLVLGIIIRAVALATSANDIYQIASGNVYVDMDNTNSENVQIENSYKIFTPWMRYGYSFYLNHINKDTKDIIQGSTAGVQFEWELHNYAAWLGIGGESAKHLDVGKSIFADGKTHLLRDKERNLTTTGVMSLGMRIVYILFGNPIYWIWDLIVNGGF